MTLCRLNLPLTTLFLLIALAFGVPAGADSLDPLAKAPQAPAAGSEIEVVTGELHELVIEDRVANVTVRHRAVRLSDGTALRLRGDNVAGFAAGSRIEVTGRRNGTTLFADAARELGSAAGKRMSGGDAAQVDGVLQMYYADYPEDRHEIGFDVKRDDGTIVPLALPVHSEALQRGMRVRATGAWLPDGTIEPDTIVIEALPDATLQSGASTMAVKTDKVLVILMRFTDSPAQPFTQAQVQAVVAGGPGTNSVAEYYKEVSYGQQLLAYTVTPWLSISAATPPNCNWSSMGTSGRNRATAAGYNLASYQKIVYVFPKVSSCGWLGLGYVGGSGAWINGANTLLVHGHELGHNFGWAHAATRDCGTNPIGGTCSVKEYGEPFGIMGQSSTMHVSSAQKFDLGWITAGEVKTHTAGTATYTLNPLESAGGTTYAVKVKPAANRTYWLEYRTPTGFDVNLANYPNNGAQIRLVAPFETLCPNCSAGSADTQMLDMTPATTSFHDGSLLVGKSFTDSTYGVTFNVLGITAAGLQVQIVGPGAAATSTTTLATSLNPSPAGSGVSFTASVTGSSPTGGVQFTANGATISGCSAVTLAGTGNVRTAVCATAALAVGTHSIVARYLGDGANPASTSSTLSQTVNPVGGGAVNVALAANGATASASSTYSSAFPIASIINNERAGNGWGAGSGGWKDATSGSWPDWVQIDFNGSKTIDRVVVYSVQDDYANPVEPSGTMNGTSYVMRDFLVQGWNGSSWVTLATVTGNSLIKRTVTFGAYTTSRIRIHVTNALGSNSRLTEVEAWTSGTALLATTTALTRTGGSNPSATGASVVFSASVNGSAPTGTVHFTSDGTTISGCAASPLSGSGNTRVATCTTSALVVGTHSIVGQYSGNATNAASTSAALSHTVSSTASINVALAGAGAVASASSTHSSAFPAASLINNERAGAGWGDGSGGWKDATSGTWPDWVQVNFNGTKTIDRVVVYSVQDDYGHPVEPSSTMTGTSYVVRDFLVQGWNGSSWVTLATVTGNTLIMRTVTFAAYPTSRIRIHVTNALGGYSRMTEVEAWTN